MSPTLTVRRHDGEDVTGDTVRPEGDTLAVISRGWTVYVDLENVRSIIAGEPGGSDEPATDEGEVLLA